MNVLDATSRLTECPNVGMQTACTEDVLQYPQAVEVHDDECSRVFASILSFVGLQGDDYVLYCHPSRQKTPKAEKLREWYHSLLDKAEMRGLVMFRSTMFDTFLPGGKDHAMIEPTSRLLPYFDGDFWPGEAEAQLMEIEKGASSTSVAP